MANPLTAIPELLGKLIVKHGSANVKAGRTLQLFRRRNPLLLTMFAMKPLPDSRLRAFLGANFHGVSPEATDTLSVIVEISGKSIRTLSRTISLLKLFLRNCV